MVEEYIQNVVKLDFRQFSSLQKKKILWLILHTFGNIVGKYFSDLFL